MLEAIIAFFPIKEDHSAIGAMDLPAEIRRTYAKQSLKYKCDICGPVINLMNENEGKEKEDNSTNTNENNNNNSNIKNNNYNINNINDSLNNNSNNNDGCNCNKSNNNSNDIKENTQKEDIKD